MTTATRRRGGLSGVVRVREVRERDSRTGLAAALAEEQQVATRIADLERQLAQVGELGTIAVTDFHARQHTIDVLREEIVAAHTQLESCRRVSLAAREKWMADRTRLDAVEALIERRLAALRLERRRREDREQDEVATELWRRQRSGERGRA